MARLLAIRKEQLKIERVRKLSRGFEALKQAGMKPFKNDSKDTPTTMPAKLV